MKVVVVGYGQMFSNLILGALDSQDEVVGVFRYERVKFSPLVLFFKNIFAADKDLSFVKSMNLYDIKARSVNSEKFKKEILRLNPDIILVGSWGEKFAKDTIALAKLATINCHPSLLPKYRGPNPYARTIMNGESESGVTFHLMDEKFDSGPILMQKSIKITDVDTGETLKNKCCLCARVLVSELLNNMKTEIIIPINQNEKDATYFPQIGVEDILIDFEKSAREIDCKIRGLQPWQSSYIPHKNVFFRVRNVQIRENNTKYTSAGTIVEKSEKTFSVISGDNKILTFNNVRLYGGIRPFLTDFYLKFFVKIGDLAI